VHVYRLVCLCLRGWACKCIKKDNVGVENRTKVGVRKRKQETEQAKENEKEEGKKKSGLGSTITVYLMYVWHDSFMIVT